MFRVIKSELKSISEKLEGIKNKVEQLVTDHARNPTLLLDVRGRMESIRDEILFEIRANSSSHPNERREKVEPKFISSDAENCETVCLNLGCGHKPLEGYINVDMRPMSGVDLVAEVDFLPYKDEEVDEIFCAHLVEHFTDLTLERRILPYWYGLLKKQGRLKIVVPDAVAMIEAFVSGQMTFEDLKLVTFGAQDYEADFHFTMFNYDRLWSLLDHAGFQNIVLYEKDRVNGLCREMEIHCEK